MRLGGQTLIKIYDGGLRPYILKKKPQEDKPGHVSEDKKKKGKSTTLYTFKLPVQIHIDYLFTHIYIHTYLFIHKSIIYIKKMQLRILQTNLGRGRASHDLAYAMICKRKADLLFVAEPNKK